MNKIISVGIVIALLLGGYATFFKTAEVINPETGEKVVVGAQPISPYNYTCFGGVCRFAQMKSLAQATSTICAIQSPAATSTLVSAAVHIDINTTASTAVIGKATTAFATTTKLAQVAIAAGTELNLVASTSPATSGANVFSPNTWLVASLEGSGAVSLDGNCQATWEQINY